MLFFAKPASTFAQHALEHWRLSCKIAGARFALTLSGPPCEIAASAALTAAFPIPSFAVSSDPVLGPEAAASLPSWKDEKESKAHKWQRRLRSLLNRYALSYLPRPFPSSTRPITLVVPLAAKDLVVAGRSIAAIKRNLRHPITEVVIPGQSHPDLKAFCAENGFRYIDENDVLPEKVKNFKYVVDGANRNGWVRQQVLKLSAFDYIEADNIFVCDADTIFLRPFSLFEGDKQILFEADEYVLPYHAMNKRLLGPIPRYQWSFVAHCMLFQRHLVKDLHAKIEAYHHKPWLDAVLDNIDHTTEAGLSEYDLYGNFLFNYHREAFVGRYWFNRKTRLRSDGDVEAAIAKYGSRFNSVSDHFH